MAGGVKRASKSGTPSAKRPRTSGGNAKLKFKSPAEFFAENKNIAGFDNPGKSLYTTIRELVENGLDAAEAMDTLPDIEITVERIGKEQFRSLVGMDAARDRVDETLYKDVENDKEKRAREAREKREAAKRKKTTQEAPECTQEASQQLSQPSQQPSQGRPRAGGNEIFRVTVCDNGSGMAYDDVPNMMGRVLAGTKYCVRQTRGKFGLGSKMALIWSKMSTGLPVHVRTARKGESITECILDIDISQNIPNIIKHVHVANPTNWRGTRVSVTIEGNWTTYRSKILLYVRQMAVITPYAQFRLKFLSGTDKDFELHFARRTDKMPVHAQEVKHHPSSVNQLLLKQLISEVPSQTSLIRFLTTQFVSIPRKLATRLIVELGSEFTPHMPVSDLSLNHIRQLDALLHEARFDKPDGTCLSPAGEYNLRLGITKELQPNMVATHAEPADVFEGHPFIVEAGVALGGNSIKPGINVFRFANRIPLLFEGGNDVVTRTANSLRWSTYKISSTTERIGVICSIVSTKIPFKGTGKEYIGDDSESIKASVKRAITQCCIQLRTKLVRQAAQKDAAQRKLLITKYIPDVTNALISLFQDTITNPDTMDIVTSIQSGEISAPILRQKLTDHVQQLDKEQAIEYATITGRDSKSVQPFFLTARPSPSSYISLQPSNSKVHFSLLSILQSPL